MKAYVDRIDELGMEEKLGVIRSMTRKARVIFDRGERPKDFSALRAAFAAIEADPYKLTPFSFLTDAGYKSLVLVGRAPRVVENNPDTVDITLQYEHFLDGANQQLLNPPPGIIFGKGRCSITQKSTNFFYPYGSRNQGRTQILVAHTFEKDDMGVVGQQLNRDLPRTVTQGGEIQVPFPEGNFQFQGVIRTNNPWRVVYTFVNATNDGLWLNGPPLTWICSEVQFDVLDAFPGGFFPKATYRFAFEFQYNEDTWYPTVVFNDQRTGRPPAKVQPATTINPDPQSPDALAQVLNYNLNPVNGNPQPAGYWTVPAIRQVDFNELFGSVFEGFNAPGFF